MPFPNRSGEGYLEVKHPVSRFFFAVAPPEPLLSRIEAFRGRWGHPHHRVEPHITVKVPFEWDRAPAVFLGSVRTACSRIPAFELKLGEPGRFRRARVLFLTVRGHGLKELHQAVVGAMAPMVPPDARGHEGERYTAHLTLAAGRFGIDEAGLDEMERAARQELADLPAFPVTALRCYQWSKPRGRWERFTDIPLAPSR